MILKDFNGLEMDINLEVRSKVIQYLNRSTTYYFMRHYVLAFIQVKYNPEATALTSMSVDLDISVNVLL